MGSEMCIRDSTHTHINVHTQILRLSKLLGLDTSIEEPLPEEEVASIGHLSRSKMSEGRGHSLIVIALTALEVSSQRHHVR